MFRPRPTSYGDRTKLPSKSVAKESIDKLFSIVQTGDYNKIKNYVSNSNTTFDITDAQGQGVLHAILDNYDPDIRDEGELYDLIKFFIDRGITINEHDNYNTTVLHMACQYQLPRIVELLLEEKADVEQVDNEDMGPLHYLTNGNIVVCKKSKKVRSLIPDSGVDVTKKQLSKHVDDKLLRELTSNLIDILYIPEFKKYITHMKNSIGSIEKIYRDDMENKSREFVEKIVQKITNTQLSDDQKKLSLREDTVEMTKEIDKHVNEKLTDVLKEMDISSGKKTGWSPKDQPGKFDRIIEEGYTDLLKEITDRNDNEIITLKNKMGNSLSKLTDAINNLDIVNGNILVDIYDIIQLHVHFNLNFYLADYPPVDQRIGFYSTNNDTAVPQVPPGALVVLDGNIINYSNQGTLGNFHDLLKYQNNIIKDAPCPEIDVEFLNIDIKEFYKNNPVDIGVARDYVNEIQRLEQDHLSRHVNKRFGHVNRPYISHDMLLQIQDHTYLAKYVDINTVYKHRYDRKEVENMPSEIFRKPKMSPLTIDHTVKKGNTGLDQVDNTILNWLNTGADNSDDRNIGIAGTSDGSLTANSLLQKKLPIEAVMYQFHGDETNYHNINIHLFTAYIIYTTNILGKHLSVIQYSINALFNHLENEYYYDVYSKIITQMIITIINIMENIKLCKNNQYDVNTKKDELKKKLQDMDEHHHSHPYEYALFQSIESVDSMIKNIDTFFATLDTVYLRCNEIHNQLNDTIELLNKISGTQIIKSYFTDAGFTFDRQNVNIDNVFDTPLEKLKELPNNLTEYMDQNYSKQELFQNYMPSINQLYHPTYIRHRALNPAMANIVGSTIGIHFIDKNNITELSTPNPPPPQYDLLAETLPNLVMPPFPPNVNNINQGEFVPFFIRNINGTLINNTPMPGADIFPKIGFMKNEYFVLNYNPVLPYGDNVAHLVGVQGLTPQGGAHDNIMNEIRVRKNNEYNRDNNLYEANPPVVFQHDVYSATHKVGVVGYNTNQRQLPMKDNIIDSIGVRLNEHLNIVKYLVVQNTMKLYSIDDVNLFRGYPANANINIDNEIKEKITSLKDKFTETLQDKYDISQEKSDTVLYTIVGRLTDQLIRSMMKHFIHVSSTEMVRNTLMRTRDNKDYSEILSHILGYGYVNPDINVIFEDTGFKLSFNILFDEIITDFHNVVRSNDDERYNRLKYTSKIMEDTEEISEQFPVYNLDYDKINDDIVKQCYRIKPEIVDILVKYGVNIDSTNKSHATPIFHAIDILHSDMVRKLVEHRATVYSHTIKNIEGLTPLEHALESYNKHTDYVYNKSGTKILENMYKRITDKIVRSLHANKDFKNNIMKYLDIMLPQTLFMFNHMFYLKMKSYEGLFSYDQFKSVLDLLVKYDIIDKKDANIRLKTIPVLEQDISKAVMSNSDVSVLVHIDKKLQKQYNDNNAKIDQIVNQQTSYKKELELLDNPDEGLETNRQVYINEKLARLEDEYDRLQEENNDVKEKLSNVKYNTSERIKTLTGDNDEGIQQVIRTFIEGTTLDTETNIDALYNNVFEILNVAEVGHEDFRLYNELWKMYINDDKKLQNVTNIHILIVVLQNSIINEFKPYSKKITKDKLEELKQDMEVIEKVYDHMFSYTIKNSLELPQDYDDINKTLKDMINIIIHVVKYTLCSNLYLATVKTVIAYVKSRTDKDNRMFRNTNNYNKFVQEIVDRIIQYDHDDADNKNSVLKKYIVDEMPTPVVKYILGIYKDDFDVHKEIQTIEQLFTPILHILQANPVFPIEDDSSIIKNLKKYVFPYYEDIFKQVIPAMKAVLDNYSTYIMNEYRHIKVLVPLLEKSVDEIDIVNSLL